MSGLLLKWMVEKLDISMYTVLGCLKVNKTGFCKLGTEISGCHQYASISYLRNVAIR